MPLPNAGSPISLGQIETEWGGVVPTSLNEYYRGGANVPDNFAGSVGIPASGAIANSNFLSTYADVDAVAALANFWPNRGSYFRWYVNGSSYPGDYTAYNNNNGNFTGSRANSYSFANSTLASVSKKATVFTWAIGAGATYVSATTTPAATGVTLDINSNSMVLGRQFVAAQPRDITASTISWARSGNRDGSWSGVFILPGTWNCTGVTFNPSYNVQIGVESVAGAQRHFDITLAPGEVVMLMGTGGGDFNVILGEQVLSGSIGCIKNASWWYNYSVVYAFYNYGSTTGVVRIPDVEVQNYNQGDKYTSGYYYFAANPFSFWYQTRAIARFSKV